MFKIINEEFFKLNYTIDETKSYVSINVMVDPVNFELRSYRRTPFCSIIVKSKILCNTLENLQDKTEERIDFELKKYLVTRLQDYPLYQYNLYTDSEYDKLASKFDNRSFHTMIYYFDIDTGLMAVEKYTIPTILIYGLPIKGIVAPIPKSPQYNLYNGVLVQCKPFRFSKSDKNEYFNKIVYSLIELKSSITISEFQIVDYTTYGYEYQHNLHVQVEDNGDMNIHEESDIYNVPYIGREDLFSKPNRNIFQLSDVPRDVMKNSESLTKKL